MRGNPFFIKLGVLMLALPALYAAIMTFLEWRPHGTPSMAIELVTQFEWKMQPLKEMIAGDVAVGYVGDHTSPQDAEGQRNFQLTQYALAPTMVTDKLKSRYFVSILPAGPLLDREVGDKGLVLVKDFGNEVRLYQRGQP